ncbi:MAG: 30S ribosome-binding factor RbfA [Opitutales bacterium]
MLFDFEAMGQRSVRVNELVKREISDILHTDYKDDMVCVTITEVDVSPDLRYARIYYSLFVEGEKARHAHRFFKKHGSTIRRKLSKRIVLKYLPALEFIQDHSLKRGAEMVDKMDDLGLDHQDG